MTEQFTDTQNYLIKQVAERNGFKNYSVEEYSTSSKGDNYVGDIRCVTIKGDDRELEIVVKRAPFNQHFRKFFSLREIFLQEIYMYDKIHPAFENFQKDYALANIFHSYPKLYGECRDDLSECLVLENMIKNGYKHWNRKLPMNSEHISFVMAEYGKYHAVSLAMKKNKPELFEKLVEGLRKLDEESEKRDLEAFLKSSGEHLERAVKGNSVLENAYKRVALNIDKYFNEELRGYKEQNIITHGDCWCNNMLFKYENPDDTGKPLKVCLLDWQMSKYSSPLEDLVYFFYASSPKAILYDYRKYLKIYHDSLSERLRQMSCDPEEIFPFENLESLWKKYARYGLFLGGLIFNILYVESKDAPQVDQNVTSVESFFNQFGGEELDRKVDERIVDLFTYMVDNDFV